ncbi:MAG: C45 family peptidase [Arenicellales bacterium]
MTSSHNATSATFQAVEESLPGTHWQALQRRLWPLYQTWFSSEGDAARPSYVESRRALRQHMPELLPTFERLCELAGGGDMVSRFLSLYCPPPYLSGCTQAVWTGDEPLLVRNYDYSAQRLEAVLLKSCWNGQTVIAMSDALWGVLDGINESGLAVSLAFGGRLESGKGFGIPLILRYILEFCKTTDEAIEVLQRVPTHMSYNITVVDPSQRFATVYVAPDKLPVVRQVPVATNHQGKVEWPRHAWATATLERESAVQSILADTEETAEGLIAGFLRPPIFNNAYRRGFGTLYTAVYRPVSRQASYLWPQHRWDFAINHFVSGSYAVDYAKE